MSPEMAKLNSSDFGYIDLYGNDIYGLSLVLEQIINSKRTNLEFKIMKDIPLINKDYIYEYLKLLFYSLKTGQDMK
jgi:hypothetical protein